MNRPLLALAIAAGLACPTRARPAEAPMDPGAAPQPARARLAPLAAEQIQCAGPDLPPDSLRRPPHSARYILRGTDSLGMPVASKEPALEAIVSGGPFAPGDDYPLNGLCLSVATGDFDSDGFADLAAAEVESLTVSIWRNDGTGHFSPAPRLRMSSNPLWIVSADFDADGALDLAVALNSSPGRVCVVRGNGDGSFAAPVEYPVGYYPDHLACGDLDADGLPDLVSADYGGFTVSVLINRGTGVFAPAVAYRVGILPAGVAIGDLDGDGMPDLAVSNNYCGTVSVLRNLGDGRFAPRLDYLTGRYPVDIVAADLDGDGMTDLAFTSGYLGPTVLWNDKGGVFTREPLARSLAGNSCITPFQLDSDSLLDLAGAVGNNWPVGAVTTCRNEGGRRFTQDVAYWFPPGNDYGARGGPDFTTFVDLDADGASDMVMARTYRYQSILTVLHRRRGRAFAGIQDYPFGASLGCTSMTAANFEGEGPDDLLFDLGGRLNVMRNRGDGTLGPREDLGPVGRFTALDLDHDGRSDVLSQVDSTVAVRLCGPDGTLGPWGVATTGTLLCTGDFDGDLTPDLLVQRADGTPWIVMNDGKGGFQPPRACNVQLASCMASADFDGDGLADLAIGFQMSYGGWANHDSVAVFLGEGDGAFKFISGHHVNDFPDLPPGQPPNQHLRSISTGDMDGDGRPDIVAVASEWDGYGRACVLLNLGAGSFAPEITYGLQSEDPFVVVADFDRDGRADLASFSYYDAIGRCLVYMSQPGGGLAPLPMLNLQCYPSTVSAGDFDDDGMTDIAVLYHGLGGAPGVSLLMNRLAPVGSPALPVVVPATVPGARLAISRVAPNPVLGSASVSLRLASASPATLALLDVSGRRVASLEIGRPAPGGRAVPLPAHAGLRPGVYWLRLTQDASSVARRVVVLR